MRTWLDCYSKIVKLASSYTRSSGARPRADSTFPLPLSRASGNGLHRRTSNLQLDPTFPRRRLPVPGTTSPTLSVRKLLKVTAPRAAPAGCHGYLRRNRHMTRSIFVLSNPSTNASTNTNIVTELSPPRNTDEHVLGLWPRRALQRLRHLTVTFTSLLPPRMQLGR